MKRALAAVACAGLLLALPGTATALKLYKWVDKAGNVTYSQQPPPAGQKSEQIQMHTSSPSTESAQKKLDTLTEKANAQIKDQEFAKTTAAEVRKRNERLKKNCEIARHNLRILESARRVRAKDAKGNPYFLDPADVKARIQESKQQIKDNCGG